MQPEEKIEISSFGTRKEYNIALSYFSNTQHFRPRRVRRKGPSEHLMRVSTSLD